MNRFFDILTVRERRKLLDLKRRLKVKGKGAVRPQVQRKAKGARNT